MQYMGVVMPKGLPALRSNYSDNLGYARGAKADKLVQPQSGFQIRSSEATNIVTLRYVSPPRSDLCASPDFLLIVTAVGWSVWDAGTERYPFERQLDPSQSAVGAPGGSRYRY
jgi:hypothetical protein